ncbi:unnamed protein product [Caenorhabditis brenneri]
MSLSRPVKFPLLKLPWLCIRCVLHNSDEFVIIYFATISDRTRRIVKSSKPLKEIDVASKKSNIFMGKGKYWNFSHNKNGFGVPLVLKRHFEPFFTNSSFDARSGHHLQSYTAGDTLDALKIGIDFMIEVFGCTIRRVFVDRDRLTELFRLGISSVKELFINGGMRLNLTDLKFLLENVSVTDRCVFNARIPEDFSCEPRIFKCRRLSFLYNGSADWVTLELLCQFDVPQLTFWFPRFSKQDIVSYVTHWFNSENRKLEYLHIEFYKPVSLEDFKIDHLDPMPFCQKRRSRRSLNEAWEKTDMSSGKDILRKDGLLATLHAYPSSVIFYVWHKRFPDAV